VKVGNAMTKKGKVFTCGAVVLLVLLGTTWHHWGTNRKSTRQENLKHVGMAMMQYRSDGPPHLYTVQPDGSYKVSEYPGGKFLFSVPRGTRIPTNR
jgi:hypothetical protein